MVVVGPESSLAAEAAECAAEQGQFFPYHDLLFQNQGPENAGYLTSERLSGFAGQIGLDTEQFSLCLDSGRYEDKVLQSSREAQALGVQSTPTVFVNGRPVQDPLEPGALRSVIADELDRKP